MATWVAIAGQPPASAFICSRPADRSPTSSTHPHKHSCHQPVAMTDCSSTSPAAPAAASANSTDASPSLLPSLQQRYFDGGYPLRLAAHPDKGRFVVATSLSKQTATHASTKQTEGSALSHGAHADDAATR